MVQSSYRVLLRVLHCVEYYTGSICILSDPLSTGSLAVFLAEILAPEKQLGRAIQYDLRSVFARSFNGIQ